ncbi:MAG: exosome complex RNA-binding protein Rrp4 [Candidatus Nanoarchaeia archaeon]|nr:exosome complex RNA-binding protein Rrp4 [Candidatus Haiyanarchaeum thermophilum]MCW1303017.1 exosome complex RNA-binding protein Rrp4 [Candidatus Haiyanarchaeum thermophilum]MCW1303695.1 exosome complex RNA-binding protein Rrp4 [Candidatus Haiyanarchaeum thermophilum]MCW1306375.1 exosome complex RNA-binding protein Rrp4 [Candidatus Haiyanarchaeum thermophilum]MCW1307115.1 exosome complex RNA-binding protein Rrp4 [Candidatus Haiyanarchaeum thermophilum]
MRIYFKNKDIVIPGELIAEGEIEASGGVYREGNRVYASKIGLLEVEGDSIKVVPLAGKYVPNKNDLVIGKIVDIGFSGWSVDIGAPYLANLPIGEVSSEFVDLLKVDLSKFFDINDIILARVINVPKSKIIQLSTKNVFPKKLEGGKIIKITPCKIPRVIGRKGSMINMIKEYTKCEIIPGQNGWIWIKGTLAGEIKATKAILTIEKESHISGLTKKIKEMLEGE